MHPRARGRSTPPDRSRARGARSLAARRPESWWGNVPVGAIRKQRHDHAAAPSAGELARDLGRTYGGGAGTVAGEQALLLDQPLGHVPTEIGRNAQLPIQLGLLVDARHD